MLNTWIRRFLLILILFPFAGPFSSSVVWAQAGAGKAAAGSSEPFARKPRLIVLLVIDQFRADYLTRFQSRFLPPTKPGGELGGFRYLISRGAYFPFAQYDILQSMTGPGHATILTGSYPYQAGVPVNEWYDRVTHQRMYCAEDPGVATVGADPSDRHVGTSPRNLVATTVGDELKNAGYPSRVVSISLKDRSAIFMGGHRADLALWLDHDSFRWVSSRFYLPDGKLPRWVQVLNKRLEKDKGKALVWEMPKSPGTGLSANAGSSYHAKEGSWASLALPLGLELTEVAAEAAIQEYHLGKGKATDLLAISFSSHDYMGHQMGPNSREMEEMTVADDRVIARFLNALRKELPGGLNEVAFVLTADHGIPPSLEWLKENRIIAGKVDEQELAAELEARLDERFGKPKNLSWIAMVESFNIYLDPRAIAQRKVEPAVVQEEIKSALSGRSWVAQVFTTHDYRLRHLPPGMFERQILHTYFEGRSGDIVVIPKPYFIPKRPGVNHLTGYSYDRTVPLILSGSFFKRGVYSTEARVIDIAPTLSFLTGVVAPSLSEGRVLSEALAR